MDQKMNSNHDWKMEEIYQETLRRIETNDPSLTGLHIGKNEVRHQWHGIEMGVYSPDDSAVFARLGDFIGNNTHLVNLLFEGGRGLSAVVNESFFEGIKRNISISRLHLIQCDLSSGAGGGIIDAISWNINTNITKIIAYRCITGRGANSPFASALSRCKNLKEISLTHSVIEGGLEEIVSSVRGHHQLERLDLTNNAIGKAGCQALALLLQDPTCTIGSLCLCTNNVDDDGAVAIANSLTKNTMLYELDLENNHAITELGANAFGRVLCNRSSINDTYSSNHTLRDLSINIFGWRSDEIAQCLELNHCGLKKLVAAAKIFIHHRYFVMEPFFEWGLKMLPFVVNWFGLARYAIQISKYAVWNNEADIGERKLSSIYQFVRAMPIMSVPARKNTGAKRKIAEASGDRELH